MSRSPSRPGRTRRRRTCPPRLLFAATGTGRRIWFVDANCVRDGESAVIPMVCLLPGCGRTNSESRSGGVRGGKPCQTGSHSRSRSCSQLLLVEGYPECLFRHLGRVPLPRVRHGPIPNNLVMVGGGRSAVGGRRSAVGGRANIGERARTVSGSAASCRKRRTDAGNESRIGIDEGMHNPRAESVGGRVRGGQRSGGEMWGCSH